MKTTFARRDLFLAFLLATAAHAELTLPALIGDHMVLQQNLANPIWGWDTPGTKVTVTFAGQTQAVTAAADGYWRVKLPPTRANATAQTLVVVGTSRREIQDVLVGEVWLCSGQSNMGLKLRADWNGDLEAAASTLPQLRLISVPNVGTQEPQTNFKGQWTETTPESARMFSAVGFLFGRYLHEILHVPVGLIENAWGGSTAEAWIRREALERDPRFAALMEATTKAEAHWRSPAGRAAYEEAVRQWTAASAQAKAEGKTPTWRPPDYLTGQKRPGNLFAGVLHPTLGYGLKGVIWYQGEANAERADEYAELFPFLITHWRQEWGQGDFPFYWVQLPNYQAERNLPGENGWAELREAQTKAQRLPHTGQAVTIDLGAGNNLHPRNKHDVAARLVRWALARDYGLDLPYHSPEYRNMTVTGGKVTIVIDCFGSSLHAMGTDEVRGFAICGEDQVWHWAKARILAPDRVEVWSPEVVAPVAVRYAWAGNPACNLYSSDGLPVSPFRTDNFKRGAPPGTMPTPER